jgi:UDP-N-acetylmuramate--L-alanine ligase
VVYTAAIHPDNPEFLEAKRLGIPMLSRAELLGQLMRCYRESIAVSGTHGKTTTTSMLSHILLAAEKDPTISLGGNLDAIGGNIRVGGNETFLLEACEYTNSFLSFFPTLEIILNIEADHLDFFKDLDDIRRSFRRFVQRMPENGTLVIDNRIRDYREIVGDFKGRVSTVGTEEADYYPTELRFDERGNAAFTPVEHGKALPRIQLAVPGEHNVYNALAALAACRLLGIPAETVRDGLEAYHGTERRFEKKGEYHGAVIVDDYAHHPQEIAATLKAAKKYPHQKLWCVFQPHTYTRTKALLPEFGTALEGADAVLLADIYAARETDTLGISSRDVADAINADQPGKARYFGSFSEIEACLAREVQAGDLVLTMGAGDIYRVGEELLNSEKNGNVK